MRTQNNHVRLIGNLGFDPEVREIAPGRKVARMSLATHESYLNAEGERVTDTQWHTVVAWGRTAEQVGLLLSKGSPVMVEGRIVHRSYPGKDGLKRYITEVVLSDFKMINLPKRDQATGAAAAA
ncbi:MAG: single-stranded DNA-binding protein [Flavobacteriales bacterium]|nr:single-stranded DNA-binding protein [Flavobacteriales bacterium]MBP9080676.1 single-stranded DNA-binding protein [Flavobacteriales bacterium]